MKMQKKRQRHILIYLVAVAAAMLMLQSCSLPITHKTKDTLSFYELKQFFPTGFTDFHIQQDMPEEVEASYSNNAFARYVNSLNHDADVEFSIGDCYKKNCALFDFYNELRSGKGEKLVFECKDKINHTVYAYTHPESKEYHLALTNRTLVSAVVHIRSNQDIVMQDLLKQVSCDELKQKALAKHKDE